MANRAPVSRAILASLTDGIADIDVVDAFDGVDEDLLVRLAIVHRVAGLVHHRVAALNVMGERGLEELSVERQRSLARHLTALQLTTQLAECLDEPWAVLKGPALAALYSAPAERSYNDLDVLVARGSFRSTLATLEEAGFTSINKNWNAFLKYGVAEVPLDAGQLVIDLHWHPLATHNQRNTLMLDPKAMLRRHTKLEVNGRVLPTLDAVDTLLHLCAHGGLGGAQRLVWIKDIDVAVRSLDIDWDVFVSRARFGGLGTISSLMLRRSRRLLATPIPDVQLRRLTPEPVWSFGDRLTSAIPLSDEARISGWERALFQRTARDRWSHSAHALRSALGKASKARRKKTDDPESRGRLDWRRDDGGEAGFERWMSYVESGER